MNYGEEIAYWYFRLNGFFPLVNFVVHRTEEIGIRYSTDIDLLAVRFPHVYEPVGGQPSDWDSKLMDNFDKDTIIGILCEVKTGNYNVSGLFKSEAVKYALTRFGFKPGLGEYADKLRDSPMVTFFHNNQKYQIAKILVSNRQNQDRTRYIHFQLADLEKFISDRIKRYEEKKWQDRMFFPSNYLAALIDQVHRNTVPKTAPNKQASGSARCVRLTPNPHFAKTSDTRKALKLRVRMKKKREVE